MLDSISRPHSRYILCGLRAKSEIPLTQMMSIAWSGNEDVSIEFGVGGSPLAQKSDRIIVEHSIGRSVIGIPEVAAFEILGGRQIYVWPAVGAATKDIEIFLFGLAWATLCHQRGLLPLHASAILTRDGIAAIVGHSGVGKSTSAAWLTKMGYELVADDILPISLGANSRPGAWPYLRRLKLHQNAIAELGWIPGPAVGVAFDRNKVFVSPRRRCDDQWRKLDRIYLIESEKPSLQLRIEPISGADAVAVLLDHTYRFDFIRDTQGFGPHLDLCARVAAGVEICRVRRPVSESLAEMVSSAIDQHIQNTNFTAERR
jgi:hypothetical protein